MTKSNDNYHILLSASCAKLSPKSDGQLQYQIALMPDKKSLVIRVCGNATGGLFSDEWIAVDDIQTCLESLGTDRPFKSLEFKSLYKKASANNPGFLAAVLRAEAVINSTENSQFLHVFTGNLEGRRQAWLKLKSSK